jgi:hypothetical protein
MSRRKCIGCGKGLKTQSRGLVLCPRCYESRHTAVADKLDRPLLIFADQRTATEAARVARELFDAGAD